MIGAVFVRCRLLVQGDVSVLRGIYFVTIKRVVLILTFQTAVSSLDRHLFTAGGLFIPWRRQRVHRQHRQHQAEGHTC